MSVSPTIDYLHGAPSIAAHMGIRQRQVYHLIEEHGLPTFKMGKTVCARRSDIDTWLADLAATARKAANQ